MESKIDSAISLLQKAEKLALLYNPNGFYLAFSEGKDSQCIYHLAKMANVKFKGHMALTSVDPPEVIRFVKNNYPDIELIKPTKSIYKYVEEIGMIPTMRYRWCCEKYKENAGAGNVVITGVRRSESARRAKRNYVEISQHKFSGDFDGLMQYRNEKLAKISKKKKQNESVQIGCIKGKESIITNPIINWTKEDVWNFLNNVVKVPHCELYDKGFDRIGCIFCPMSNLKTKRRWEKEYPHQKQKWISTIKKLQSQKKCWEPLKKYAKTEDEYAELIFDWWISGISVKDYINKKFIQTKINFEEYDL